MGKREIVFRNHVYYANLGNGWGSEQSGIRPVIVVSNNVNNRYSPTIDIVPLTSEEKTNLPVHHLLKKKDYPFLSQDSWALCEQIKTIDKMRVKEFIGVVEDCDIQLINQCIKVQLALN